VRKDPRRYPRVAARRLLRFLEENSEGAALVGNSYLEAAQALRDMTERRLGDGPERLTGAVRGQ
jgi:hypothetical protein